MDLDKLYADIQNCFKLNEFPGGMIFVVLC